MRSMKGKVVAGTVAAALLLGGWGGVLSSPAYADDRDETTVVAPVNTSIPLAKRVNVEMNLLVLKASGVLDIDMGELSEKLESGKSLAEVATEQGSTAAALTDKLTEMTLLNVKFALQNNKITQEEADGLTQKVTEQIQKAVNKAGYTDRVKQSKDSEVSIVSKAEKAAKAQAEKAAKAEKEKAEKAAKAAKAKKVKAEKTGKAEKKSSKESKSDELAKLLGMTKQDLEASRAEGKSIADIASEKGISEDQLVAKLKDGMTSKIQSYIHKK